MRAVTPNFWFCMPMPNSMPWEKSLISLIIVIFHCYLTFHALHAKPDSNDLPFCMIPGASYQFNFIFPSHLISPLRNVLSQFCSLLFALNFPSLLMICLKKIRTFFLKFLTGFSFVFLAFHLCCFQFIHCFVCYLSMFHNLTPILVL